MKHAHAEILHRLVDDADLPAWFWFPARQEWLAYKPVSIMADTCGQYQFALGDKPTSPPKRYAMVEGVKVPMTHLTVAPEKDAPYWFIDDGRATQRAPWWNDEGDRSRFAALNCYATEEDAKEAATAWAQVRKIAFERAK